MEEPLQNPAPHASPSPPPPPAADRRRSPPPDRRRSPPPPTATVLNPRFSFSGKPSAAASASPCVDDDVSEHPLISLYDWWLERVDGDDSKVAVGGMYMRKDMPFSMTPAAIAKCHRASTLETDDGTILCLEHGSLNFSRMEENGYPTEVTKEFMLGFPYWWKSCLARYPRTTGSHAEPQSGSSNSSNAQKDSDRFYLDAFRCGTSYNSAVSAVFASHINKAKSSSGNDTDAFQKSSHLPNGTPRFEEYTSADGIATNEKAAASNDDRGSCSVLCDEVDNQEIDLTAGSDLRERGHDDIVTDVSLAPTVECTNHECDEGADNILPTSTCGQKTPAVLLKTQDCRERAQHETSIEKPVGHSKEQRSHEKLVAATRSPVIPSSGAYVSAKAHQTPVARGRKTRFSAPESLKLTKARSGRFVIPTLDEGLHRVVYDRDGSFSGVESISGTVLISATPPEASELKTYKRKRAVSELKTDTRKKKAVSELKTDTRKKKAVSELKTYTRKKKAVSELKTYMRKKKAASELYTRRKKIVSELKTYTRRKRA
ncbi:hypothetical protein ACP4OV_012429 [Aristida adscensionis]